MTTQVTIVEGSDLPDLAISWLDRTGSIIDYSSGYTFTVKVGVEGGAASITKTSNIVGAATSPNILVSWATSEIGTLSAGRYVIEVIATATDGRERRRQLPLLVTRKLT